MNQRTRITFTLSLGFAVAAFNYASADSLYVTDMGHNTVNKYDAETGALQQVLIPYPGDTFCRVPQPPETGIPPAGCLVGPNGIIVINVNAPQLLIANQNANLMPNGDIRVFVPGLPVFPVPSIYCTPQPCSPKPMPMANDPNSPVAPFGIFLYATENGTEILITDEAGAVKVFDARTATFLPDLDIGGYNPPGGFHPFGMVVGPDGYLYVTSRCPGPGSCKASNGPHGDVIRFDLNTKQFKDVFITGATCGGGIPPKPCLDRPNAVVFGPDQRLYVANTVLASDPPLYTSGPPLNTPDTDNIVIFNGQKPVGTIDLGDTPGKLFNLPGALLFGPGGLLYVDIVHFTGVQQDTGAVFQCSVTTKNCSNMNFVPLGSTQQRPTGLTFGRTNPATLAYENNDQNND
jgi:hypothetical protein